ncbi:MAG: nitrate/nitrite transporter NrtS [Rhodobacteraceae bacterium]|nr:nitrate/nitrite transporter NrtS [Paracoccaceae bacterium]
MIDVNSAEARPPLSKLVFGDGTPKKAFLTALVVGTILTLINHGDQIFQGHMPSLTKVALTYCVPYCVTTWGAVTGKLAKQTS